MEPFARVVEHPAPSPRNQFALYIGPLYCDRSAYQESLQEDADRINAAVAERDEKREAKLRGALGQVDHILRQCDAMVSPHVELALSEARGVIIDALANTGPDYVPVAELRASEEKVRQFQAAFDVLEARGMDATGKVVRDFLLASGLKDPGSPAEVLASFVLPATAGRLTRLTLDGEQQTYQFAMSYPVDGPVVAELRRAAAEVTAPAPPP